MLYQLKLFEELVTNIDNFNLPWKRCNLRTCANLFESFTVKARGLVFCLSIACGRDLGGVNLK